jgi:hypothetical protein
MGSVTVKRRKAVWRDLLRAYTVTIDGKAVGKLSSGEEATFQLTSGPHEVRMKIDWAGSPGITVDGSADTALECDAAGNSLMALIDAVFRPGKYIALERSDRQSPPSRPTSPA